jgi:pyroglutamyl-peptidase
VTKRILVSGFEPFGGESINPTERLVEALGRDQALDPDSRALIPPDAEVRPVLLPVTFDSAFKKLKYEIRAFDPHLVLAFGLAAGRGAVEFERVAINCLDAEIADNAGQQPRGLPIEALGAPAYFSTLPVRELVAAVQNEGLPARISNSAGTYVCNFLMYRLLEMNVRSQRRCGFIHVPFLPEQVSQKSGVPSLSFDELLKAVRAILHAL